jgi:hypothetical protein
MPTTTTTTTTPQPTHPHDAVCMPDHLLPITQDHSSYRQMTHIKQLEEDTHKHLHPERIQMSDPHVEVSWPAPSTATLLCMFMSLGIQQKTLDFPFVW